MRLLITAVVDGAAHDLAVDVDQDGTVADLQAALAPVFPSTQAGLRLVGAPHAVGSPPPAPALYLGPDELRPEAGLQESAVRHGAVVGVGRPVPDVLREPHGLVEIRVCGGPDAGRVVRWDPGAYEVGASPDADLALRTAPEGCLVTVTVSAAGEVDVDVDAATAAAVQQAPERTAPLKGPIVLNDPDAPEPAPVRRRWWRRAKVGPARVLPEGTQTVDPQEPAPLVHLERRPMRGRSTWRAGEVLSIGGAQLQLVDPTEADASLSLSPSGATLDYNRPPRLLPPERTTVFGLPSEPHRGERIPFPLLMALIPLAMGVAMYLVSKSAYSLIFIGLAPLMAVGGYFTQRRMNKERYAADMKSWTARMQKIQAEALEALVVERTDRRRDFADPGEVLMTAAGPRARLWERRPTDPDWLQVRVGVADQLSDVQIKDPDREEHEGNLVWTAPDVPVTVPLAEAGVTGVGGPAAERLSLARWIVAQAATMQSPTQLSMVLLSDPAHERDWAWTRWVPHLRSAPDRSEISRLGVDDAGWSQRIGELTRELAHRAAQAEARGTSAGAPAAAMAPILTVLDGARSLRLRPGVVSLLQEGPRLGLYFLCLDDDARLLPEECQAVVDVRASDGGSACTVRRTEHADVEAVRPDLVSPEWAERLGRALAPVRDVTEAEDDSALPGASRLLDVIGLDVSSPQAVLGRWRAIGRTTEAIIGEGMDGPFAIDIRRDGPHGLIAGTTGSGKSELLQTIIASLAVDNRPDEMNFVLVDYKGGAAFKDCNRLPHTVGMVTDLDGHLTTRALDSLGAELRRREHQLAGADAKDIEDYLAAVSPGDEPMPRLLIIIDEFAALVAELPDFVTGLVDIARRGRSLGVHLILATQRPAGVVSAEIKSNTNLRIALRVTDQDDSADVLESPVAAHIGKSTPGRAYARLGHSSLTAFQSSRVGGRPRGATSRVGAAVRALAFPDLGRAQEDGVQHVEEDASIPTDLATLVQVTQQASAESGVAAPAPPWLPALDNIVTLDELLELFPGAAPTSEHLQIPYGLADVPREQRRDVATYDLAGDGHLAVVGAGRSGRSYVLRALAGAVGRLVSPRDVHMFGVDCGNNALLPLVAMPHVGAVVTRDQVDRMTRLVRRLQDEMSRRQQQLAIEGYADIAEQRAGAAEDDRLPFIMVLFDRWEGFVQAYENIENGALLDGWMQILQEGAGVGIKLVLTGDRQLTVGRITTLLESKVMLRMLDPADFADIGLGAKEVPASMPDGRGFIAGESPTEAQVILHTPDPAGTAQVAELQAIGRDATVRHADLPESTRPFRVDVLPTRMTLDQALALPGQRPDTVIPVAVGGDTLTFKGPDVVRHGPGLLVTGGRSTGRSTTLMVMAELQLAAGWEIAVVTPRLSPLRALVGRAGVHGWFTEDSDRDEVEALLRSMAESEQPTMLLVDDLEMIDIDGWLGEAIDAHITALRDTGSVVVGAGSAMELSGQYRGPASTLKRSGSGVMLAPQSSSDTDLFGIMLPRSSQGLRMPPGGGYLVLGGQYERVQVVTPG